MKLRQISKKGASYEIKMLKGKANQTRKLQRCVVHPNSLEYKGKFCPVAVLDAYLLNLNGLGDNSDNSYIFPHIGAKFTKVLQSHLI